MFTSDHAFSISDGMGSRLNLKQLKKDVISHYPWNRVHPWAFWCLEKRPQKLFSYQHLQCAPWPPLFFQRRSFLLINLTLSLSSISLKEHKHLAFLYWQTFPWKLNQKRKREKQLWRLHCCLFHFLTAAPSLSVKPGTTAWVRSACISQNRWRNV